MYRTGNDDVDGRKRHRKAPVTVGQGLDIADVLFRAPQFKDENWAAGALWGNKAEGFTKSLTSLKGFAGLSLTDVAFSGALAPQGQTVQKTVGALGATAASAAGSIAGFMLAGPAGAILGGVLADPYGRRAAENAYTTVTETSRRIRRLDFGDTYKDSEMAFTMRQRAAQELGGSLLNARQYLGREGALFHQ